MGWIEVYITTLIFSPTNPHSQGALAMSTLSTAYRLAHDTVTTYLLPALVYATAAEFAPDVAYTVALGVIVLSTLGVVFQTTLIVLCGKALINGMPPNSAFLRRHAPRVTQQTLSERPLVTTTLGLCGVVAALVIGIAPSLAVALLALLGLRTVAHWFAKRVFELLAERRAELLA
jgi:hypothetical protein